MWCRGSRTLVAVVATALVVAACGDDSFTRADAVERLRDAGVSEPAATCIVDSLLDEVGLEELNVERDPTTGEREVIDVLRRACADGSVSQREQRDVDRALDAS